MPVFELVVVKACPASKKPQRAPTRLVERLIAPKPSPEAVKATLDAKFALASSNVARRKAEKLQARWTYEERREQARAKREARTEALKESLARKAEMAEALTSQAQAAILFKAQDSVSRLKLATRKQLAVKDSLSAKHTALERQLQAAAERRQTVLQSRADNAANFLRKASAAKALHDSSLTDRAFRLRAEAEAKANGASERWEAEICGRVAATIRHSFRVAAVQSRKRAREMLRAAKAQAEIEAAQEHAMKQHTDYVNAVRSKAAMENERVTATVREAAQASELRRLALSSRVSARRARAAVQRRAIRAKLLQPGDRVSIDGEHIITPRGSWKAGPFAMTAPAALAAC